MTSDSEAAAAASSCLEAVSVDAAEASSLFSGVVTGDDSSFSSGFSSSSTFLCPGRWRVNDVRGLGPPLVRPNRPPELGRAPGLLGAAVVEDAAVLEVLVLADFPPKRLLPPKRFLPLLAGAAVVVVGSASAGDDVLSSSSGSSSFWCRECIGEGRRPNWSLLDGDRGVGRLRRSPPSSLRVDDVAGVVVVVDVVCDLREPGALTCAPAPCAPPNRLLFPKGLFVFSVVVVGSSVVVVVGARVVGASVVVVVVVGVVVSTDVVKRSAAPFLPLISLAPCVSVGGDTVDTGEP